MGVSIWEGGKANSLISAIESLATNLSDLPNLFENLEEAAEDAGEAAVSTTAYKESVAALVRGVVDEIVTGTTPTITGEANHRYLCGEVTEISITPPQTGTIDVIFTSGTTAAILTLPNTVIMPSWFDATALETSKVYEINIADGVYGVVTTWDS